MKIVKPHYIILSPELVDPLMLKNIERAGRTCYKSDDKITDDSAADFVRMIIRRGHESVLEHEKISVQFVCDRGVSHELVRHRIASFSQESTRYCDYSKDKFGGVTFIIPNWLDLDPGEYTLATDRTITNGVSCWDMKAFEGADLWLSAMIYSENNYRSALELGWSPQQARSVLPNSLKTEIVVTANLREWRTILKQRTATVAHPQMRELMCPLLDELKRLLPVVFEDIHYKM